jgi:hypothetical protein
MHGQKTTNPTETERALMEYLGQVHNTQKAVLRALKKIEAMKDEDLPEGITKLDLLIELQNSLEKGHGVT